MIQRIQTLFLLIAIVLLFILLFAPVAILQVDETIFYEIYTKGYMLDNTIQYSYSLLLLNVLIIMISFITIFLFKKRLLQMRLCIYNIILLLGLQGVIFYTIYATASKLNAEIYLQYAVLLPVISAVLHLLAFKYIKRDEEMVKAADRIR